MGICLSRFFQSEVISEKSLYAVQDLIYYLKRNLRHMDVFHVTGNNLMVRQIVGELTRGNRGIRNILEEGWTLESASALQHFLIRLKFPLIPVHIQALALDDNQGVPAEVVAQDILGLLKQDIKGRHAVLITNVLDLLNCVLKYSPNDELLGCNIPVSMIPAFFQLQAHHIPQWRRVAMVFVEMVRLAPMYFLIDSDNDLYNDRITENPDRPMNQYHIAMQQRLLEINTVMRRYFNNRSGYRGDTTNSEITQINRNRRPRVKRHRRRPRATLQPTSSEAASTSKHNYSCRSN